MIMPLIFIGHGSPMNAIEDNIYTRTWEQMARSIPEPTTILVVSAHWYTRGARLMTNPNPHTIYDFYGFPDALYRVKYPAKGATDMADVAHKLLDGLAVNDNTYGLDHGAWSVLAKMYPHAHIPVTQISIDSTLSLEETYAIGKKLSPLREQGVLILGSGNVVHNLRLVDFSMENGYDWAYTFDNYIRENIQAKNYENIMHYKNAGTSADKAFSSLDHFYPLLYILGAANEEDRVTIYNEACTLGSLSMTSYVFSLPK